MFADITVSSSVALLGGLLSALMLISALIGVVVAGVRQTTARVLREERDDYKTAYEHAKAQVTELQHTVDGLRRDLDTLKGVVNGTTAVKESTDLLLAVGQQQHAETIAAIRGLLSEVKTLTEQIVKNLGRRQ